MIFDNLDLLYRSHVIISFKWECLIFIGKGKKSYAKVVKPYGKNDSSLSNCGEGKGNSQQLPPIYQTVQSAAMVYDNGIVL